MAIPFGIIYRYAVGKPQFQQAFMSGCLQMAWDIRKETGHVNELNRVAWAKDLMNRFPSIYQSEWLKFLGDESIQSVGENATDQQIYDSISAQVDGWANDLAGV